MTSVDTSEGRSGGRNLRLQDTRDALRDYAFSVHIFGLTCDLATFHAYRFGQALNRLELALERET